MSKRILPSRLPRRITNSLVTGAGANTTSDLGAIQRPAAVSSNPYFTQNYMLRYQTYVNLYETAWEARKIIDIPVDDCMRQPTQWEGLSFDDEQIIARAWDDYSIERQLIRALKQERLLGGSVLLGVMLLQDGEDLGQPLNIANMVKGDLKAVNVVDISRLSRGNIENDVFSSNYDGIRSLVLNGIEVDVSRMVVLDGDALLGRNSQRLMQMYRYNPLGFGESKLAPLYDALMRSLGTQQAAYQLVNRASMLLVMTDNLRSLKAMDNAAEQKLHEIVRQLSVYHGAVIDAKDAAVETRSVSFGSVPELLNTYTQFLAAASDIPQTRFMGDSAGGLNATGEGDSRNYYDMIDSLRERKRKPAERKLLEWIGSSVFGYEDWKRRSVNLKLTYPPLWNINAVEQANRDNVIVQMMVSLYSAGAISAEAAVKELMARDLFSTKIEAEDALNDAAQGMAPQDVVEPAPQGEQPGPGPSKSVSVPQQVTNADDDEEYEKYLRYYDGALEKIAMDLATKEILDAMKQSQEASELENADWKESDHKRDKDGKFGAGGGGSTSKSSDSSKSSDKSSGASADVKAKKQANKALHKTLEQKAESLEQAGKSFQAEAYTKAAQYLDEYNKGGSYELAYKALKKVGMQSQLQNVAAADPPKTPEQYKSVVTTKAKTVKQQLKESAPPESKEEHKEKTKVASAEPDFVNQNFDDVRKKCMHKAYNEQEVDAFNEYAGHMYGAINGYLRGVAPKFSEEDERHLNNLIGSMKSTIDKSTLSAPVKVVRGIAISKEDFEANYKPGKQLTEKGFMSVSVQSVEHPNNAYFAKTGGKDSDIVVSLQGTLKTGTKAACMQNVIGKNPYGEDELVMNPGKKYKIKSVEKRHATDYINGGYDYYKVVVDFD